MCLLRAQHQPANVYKLCVLNELLDIMNNTNN